MRALAAVAAAGLMIIALGAGALAQEDLEKGKTGAQIFATDCAVCHKTPQAVLKGGAPGEGFLRQHYTASREAAASVAAYLRGFKPPARAERPSKQKSSAKPVGEKEAKPVREKGAKSVKQAQPAEAKPAPSETKPAASETKPAEKGSDAKAGETKAPEQKDQPAEKKE